MDLIVKAQSHYFRLNVRVEGNPRHPALVLIHGLGCSVEYWRFVFQDQRLNDKYRLVALDLPGFGKSSKPLYFSYSMKDQAIVVQRLLLNLSIRPEVLVGFSMGGPIAIHVAGDMGTKRIVLVEPTITKNDLVITPRLARTPALLLDSLKLLTFISPAFFAKLLVHARNEQILHIVNKALRQTPGRVMKKASKELVKSASDPETYRKFQSLPASKAIILGESLWKSSHYNPPSTLFEVAERKIIPSANHAVMLDNPRAFNETLGDLSL